MSNWFHSRLARNPTPDPVVIPNRYADVSWESMRDGALKDYAKRYIANFMDNAPKGIGGLIVGRSGTGKTHTAAVIAKAVNRVIDAALIQSPVFIAQIERARFSTQSSSLIELACTTGFLVMDDFDQFDSTSYTSSVLIEIGETRYSNLLPTLWTGNFEITDLKKFTNHIATKHHVGFSRRLIESTEGFRFYVK